MKNYIEKVTWEKPKKIWEKIGNFTKKQFSTKLIYFITVIERKYNIDTITNYYKIN